MLRVAPSFGMIGYKLERIFFAQRVFGTFGAFNIACSAGYFFMPVQIVKSLGEDLDLAGRRAERRPVLMLSSNATFGL